MVEIPVSPEMNSAVRIALGRAPEAEVRRALFTIRDRLVHKTHIVRDQARHYVVYAELVELVAFGGLLSAPELDQHLTGLLHQFGPGCFIVLLPCRRMFERFRGILALRCVFVSP